MHGGFLVNAEGQRFGDETMGYSEYALESLKHANGQAWIVLDQRIFEACESFSDFQATVESGALKWADDAAELAAATGISAAGLQQTLDQTQRIAAGEAADKIGRAHV